MKACVLLAAIVAAMSAACLGPSADAPLAPYREPRGNVRDFRGMPNAPQRQHLYSATFPRLRPDEKKLLRRINNQVNRDLTYLPDWQNYGVADHHATEPPVRRPRLMRLPPARYADCEDYALTKKHRLAQAGFSASRMFVVMANVPDRQGHALHSVLAVPEGSEWLILNNWHNGMDRASVLERWWDWKFILPRYDSHRVATRTRQLTVQPGTGAATAPANAAPARQ
jgi:predicted transglutaminase-like cysteine proteinase